jgi:hypothetical protein
MSSGRVYYSPRLGRNEEWGMYHSPKLGSNEKLGTVPFSQTRKKLGVKICGIFPNLEEMRSERVYQGRNEE